MQGALPKFVDFNPGRQQGPEYRPGRVELHEGLVLPLQQQAHPHAAVGRLSQELAATEEKLTVTIKRGDRQMELEYTPNSGRAGQGGAP